VVTDTRLQVQEKLSPLVLFSTVKLLIEAQPRNHLSSTDSLGIMGLYRHYRPGEPTKTHL